MVFKDLCLQLKHNILYDHIHCNCQYRSSLIGKIFFNTFIYKKSTLYNMLSVAKIDMKNDVQKTLNYFFSAIILNMQKKEVLSKKILFYETW